MKTKIEDLTIFALVQVILKNLQISSYRDGKKIIYPSDGIFLLKDIYLEKNMSEGDFFALVESSFSLFSLIQKFLISISIEESLLTDSHNYKAKCFGTKRSWESNQLIKACFMAVVGWYVDEKYIEVNDFLFDDADLDCTIFIESLNLPIMLVLKLKSRNIKTLKDLRLTEDKILLDQLRLHGIEF